MLRPSGTPATKWMRASLLRRTGAGLGGHPAAPLVDIAPLRDRGGISEAAVRPRHHGSPFPFKELRMVSLDDKDFDHCDAYDGDEGAHPDDGPDEK